MVTLILVLLLLAYMGFQSGREGDAAFRYQNRLALVCAFGIVGVGFFFAVTGVSYELLALSGTWALSLIAGMLYRKRKSSS